MQQQQLVFIMYLLWGTLGMSPGGAVPGKSSIWAQLLHCSSHTHTLGRISRFAGVSGEARIGLCLKCKSTGPGEEEISFWKVLSVLVDAGRGTEWVSFWEWRKSQI